MKKYKIFWMILLISLSTSLISCAGVLSTQNNVNLAPAVNKELTRNPSMLLYANPSASIAVCDEDDSVADKILQAVEEWAKVIDRNKALVFEKYEFDSENRDCKKPNYPASFIIIGLHDNSFEKESAMKQKVTTSTGAAKVKFRDNNPDYKIILHEAGHLWGMCDQKDENSQKFGLNCKSTDIKESEVDSVMGRANQDTLTQKDKQGLDQVKEIVELDESFFEQDALDPQIIEINKEWKEYFSEVK